MSLPEQSFATHAKIVPAYHYVVGILLLATLVWAIAGLLTDFSLDRFMTLALVVTVLMIGFFARVFPLGVQDRVIRLEERLRMQGLLPEDLKSRIADFTTEQLIGLRFASDEELPELARKVLDEGIADRKQIKQAVVTWRADHQRI